MYHVVIRKKVLRRLQKLPRTVQGLLQLLQDELEQNGPIQKGWSNFSDLGKGKYHCHLQAKYVACWAWTKGSSQIEIYYVGSREDAPY